MIRDRSQVEHPSNAVRRPAGMIPVGEAVRRALNSDQYEGARNRDAARSWVRRIASTINDVGLVAREGGRLWVHPSIHPALGELPDRDRSAALLKDLPSGKRNRVFAKVKAIRSLQSFCKTNRLGITEARERFAAEQAEAFRDGEQRFGALPRVVIADNGKPYTSWHWTGGKPRRRKRERTAEFKESAEGLFALCGIEPSWALPYNPNGKRIERWFHTMNEQFLKAFPSYCGSSPNLRPEAHKDLVAKAVPFDEFVAALAEYVKAFNDRPHTGEGMDDRTPLQVFRLAPSERKLDPTLRPYLMAFWHREVSIGRAGIGIRLAGTTLRYGARDPALNELPIGTKVRVSYDPEDLRTVHVWGQDGKHLCEAELNQKFNRAIPAEDLRETLRQVNREKRKLREARKVGIEHLFNPVPRTVAALNRDSKQHRQPDPPGPEGTPIIQPVRVPLTVPDRRQHRMAVGAEGMDTQEHLRAFLNQRPEKESSGLSVSEATRRLGGGGES